MRGGPGLRSHAKPQAVYDSPLITAVVVSAIRLGIGFIFSILLGGIIGMAMWRFLPLDNFLGPLLLGLQTLPSVCWVPLGVLLFGINETGVMFVLIMGSFSAIAIALRDGLRTMPPLYQRRPNARRQRVETLSIRFIAREFAGVCDEPAPDFLLHGEVCLARN